MFNDWLTRRMRSNMEKDYIEFTDPAVEAICASTWGDGVGITYAQAAAVTSFGTVFKGNTSIISFDESIFFTSVTSYGSNNSGLSPFSGCTSLVSIDLSNATYLGWQAFYGCSSLVTVGSLENVTYIGRECFLNTPLADIVYAPNLATLDYQASFKGTKIPSVTSLGRITVIDGYNASNGAFYGCSELASVILPNTLTSIGQGAFSGCVKLATINLPTSLTTIKTDAFFNTIITNDINLPNLITLEGPKTFRNTKIVGITSLGSITTLPNGSGGNGGIFRDCTELESAILPNTLTTVGPYTFSGCSSLVSINLPQSITTIGAYSFGSIPAHFEVNVPNLTSIDSGAFRGSGVTKVVSLGNLTDLYNFNGAGAFRECASLTEVNLPSTLTIIRSNSFYDCTSLTTVKIAAMTPPTLEANVFRNAPLAHIYVPAASVDAYKAASGWSSFASIIEAIPTI